MSEQTPQADLRTTILWYFAGALDTEGGAIDELGIADDVAFSDAFDRCVNDELLRAIREPGYKLLWTITDKGRAVLSNGEPQAPQTDHLAEAVSILAQARSDMSVMPVMAHALVDIAQSLRALHGELAVAQRALTTACDNLAELTCECRCPWLQAVQTSNDTLCEQVSTYPCTACETPHPAECWARWYTDRARAAMQSEREAATRGN